MSSVSAQQMQEIDRLAQERYGVSVLLLMENAGRAVAEAARDILKKKRGETVAVLCGSGHNGGDGVVAARYLVGWGYDVHVLWIKNPEQWQGDVGQHYRIAKNAGVSFSAFESTAPSARPASLKKYDVLVDALLGTGITGEVRGLYREAIEAINAAGRPVIAVDIPSGLDTDTGKPLGVAVKADVTVTMAAAKIGLLKPAALPYVGRLVVADIGIPQKLLA